MAYEGLIPAPRHNYCNGICEGCQLAYKCMRGELDEEYYEDDK